MAMNILGSTTSCTWGKLDISIGLFCGKRAKKSSSHEIHSAYWSSRGLDGLECSFVTRQADFWQSFINFGFENVKVFEEFPDHQGCFGLIIHSSVNANRVFAWEVE